MSAAASRIDRATAIVMAVRAALESGRRELDRLDGARAVERDAALDLALADEDHRRADQLADAAEALFDAQEPLTTALDAFEAAIGELDDEVLPQLRGAQLAVEVATPGPAAIGRAGR